MGLHHEPLDCEHRLELELQLERRRGHHTCARIYISIEQRRLCKSSVKKFFPLPRDDDTDLLCCISLVVRDSGKMLKAPFSLSALPGAAASVLVARWAK